MSIFEKQYELAMKQYESLPLSDRVWVSPYNFEARIFMPNLPKKVTLRGDIREAEQAANVSFDIDDKITLIKAFQEIGIDSVGVGYPYRSKVDAETADKLEKEGITIRKTASVVGFLPDWKEEIDAAIDSGVNSFGFIFRCSDIAIKWQMKMTRDQWIQRAIDIIEYGKSRGVTIFPGLTDTTRIDINFFKTKVAKMLLDAGAKAIGVSDTAGTITPPGMRYLIRSLNQEISVRSVHCHNDFGLAVANSLAAVEEGVTSIGAVANGLGERAGNAALDECVCALEFLYGVDTGIKTEKLTWFSKLFANLAQVPLPPTKPLTGKYAFTHKLDSHIFGAIQDPRNYEGIPPELVGNKRIFPLGKYTGPYVLDWKLDQLGLKATDKQIEQMIPLIERKAYELRRDLTDEEFKEIYNKIVRK